MAGAITGGPSSDDLELIARSTELKAAPAASAQLIVEKSNRTGKADFGIKLTWQSESGKGVIEPYEIAPGFYRLAGETYRATLAQILVQNVISDLMETQVNAPVICESWLSFST